MKRYKVKNTSIMHNGSVAKDGDIIELSEEQAKKLEDYVELLVPKPKKQETKSNKTKTTETKTDDNSQTSASLTDGGNDGE